MSKRLYALVLGLATLPLPAMAAPSFCTGTTTVITSGTFVAGSTLVNIGPGTSTGNCVEASDKIFGAFSVGGSITGGGSAGWLFTMAAGPADVTLGFQGLVGSNSSGFVNYSVAVDPAKSNGALIDDLEKDFTFNSTGAGTTATLTGVTSPTAASFTGGDVNNAFKCTRTNTTSTCPQTGFFSPTVSLLTVDETVTTGPNTNVTGLTDTVSQIGVPEPTSLAILASALIGFGLWYRRRNV